MQLVLSIVLPVFNEAASLPRVLERVRAAIETLGIGYEILCIDDGSTDGTAELLDAMAQDDPHLRTVSLTRNFGKEAALQAGLELARGEAAVFMDGDLQHPPELIPRMVELWREGAWLFNVLFGAAVAGDTAGASDFKLVSRSAMDARISLPERKRFFRGLVHWIGFRTIQVDFDVERRTEGRSRWSRLALARYAIDNLISFTTFPLVLIATAGLLTSVLGSALAVIALQQWFRGVAVSGFTTVILLVTIFSGMIVTCLGVMSLYLACLFEEVKGRPIFRIRASAKPWPHAFPLALVADKLGIPLPERLGRRSVWIRGTTLALVGRAVHRSAPVS